MGQYYTEHEKQNWRYGLLAIRVLPTQKEKMIMDLCAIRRISAWADGAEHISGVKRMKHAVAIASGILATAVAMPAWAGEHVFAAFGSTITLNGTVESDNASNADPFTLQVFSTGSECLVIAVTSQQADLEATLVGPSGRVWQDDDGNGSLRPLIKALTVTRGWHSLTVSHFAGTAVHADFTFQITRAASNSTLCSPPTISSFQTTARAKPASSVFDKLPGGTR
jgi:hypothetical protein